MTASPGPATTGVRPSLVAPLALTFLRIPLLAVAFTAVSAALLGAGVVGTWDEAWRTAADHAYVVLNVAVDLPCLLALALVLRREGRRLRDLLGPGGLGPRRTVLRGLAVFAVMAAMFGLFPVVVEAVVGAAPYPGGLTDPPVWVVVWTVVVFPLVTGPAEELLFRGYALPALHGAVRRSSPRVRRAGTVLAVAVTALGFGVAHTLIPPVGEVGTLVARALTLTAIGVVLDLIRLRTRHLGPLVLGHVLLDAVLIGGFTVLAATT